MGNGAAGEPPVRVVSIVTKLSVGGAQETVLRCCALLDHERFETLLVAGPETSPEGDLHERAQRMGVPVRTVSALRRPINPLFDAIAIVQLMRLLHAVKPSIVHTHSSKAGLLGRMAARLARAPVVVHTIHGWSFHDYMSSSARHRYIMAERIAARFSDALIVVTERDRQEGLARRIGHPSKYHLIRSGIETGNYRRGLGARQQARELLGVSTAPEVVGTVTRLSTQKDPATLLRAFAIVARARRSCSFVVIGDGPLRSEVDSMLNELQLTKRVVMAGSRSDVAALLPAFDVFVSSSLWEGLPRVVTEAVAAGIPVVTTNAGGVGELVVHEVSGLMVPPKDPEALADAVLRVLDNPVLGQRLASEASDRIEEYGTEAMIGALDRLYSRCLRD
jgi:glycosyltransferase involved in cell wall biosynthesis